MWNQDSWIQLRCAGGGRGWDHREYESWRGKKSSAPSAKPSIASGTSFFASTKSSFVSGTLSTSTR
ncbi:Hypothetical protein FKW44_018798 [Caligus rogercresseyi]|uniref:Uncharacterized protein n=1 Tax=Caligus rogercresseyi TaxID=217165 RepID=A0A7T8GUW2_CALRO|nr:Hypothetical protein FKW44_018798 [Caligus rogercresseyi]